MISYNQIFNVEYRDIVINVSEKPKLSFINRIKRFYHILIKKHIKITEYEFYVFCKLAYSNGGVLQTFVNQEINNKYEIVEFINSDDGLQFYVIKAKLTKDLIVAFRGTDEWIDWLTNLQIRNKGRQFTTAKLYLDKLIAQNIDHQIYFCGHSLGGALAQEMYLNYSTYTKVKLKGAITFNSAGVRAKGELAYPNLAIRNYIVESDMVGTSTGYHYGEVIFVLAKTINNKSLLNLYTHSLEQFIFDDEGNVCNQINFENVKNSS